MPQILKLGIGIRVMEKVSQKRFKKSFDGVIKSFGPPNCIQVPEISTIHANQSFSLIFISLLIFCVLLDFVLYPKHSPNPEYSARSTKFSQDYFLGEYLLF